MSVGNWGVPEFNGERVVPWGMEGNHGLLYHHVMRYTWAMQYVAGARIVDLGCGTGYGSFMLSWVAKYVTGLDLDGGAIAMAKARFWSGNLDFKYADLSVEKPPLADIYVAFEFLEHLEHPEHLLKTLKAPLIASVPIEDANPFHKKVFSVMQAEEFFRYDNIHYQGNDGRIWTADEWSQAGIEGRPTYVLSIMRPG